LYDTTGQVVQSIDPAGNPTCYSYADNFFNETGPASMSSFTAPAPTNAYPKTITTGGLTFTFGYYFGSGKRTFSVDPNNATTSYFFSDARDRLTQTTYPIGWKLVNYTSATQTDTYVPVADTSASSSCTSCVHNQGSLDSWGRKVNQKLVNAPGGAINVDTTYDATSRVYTVSHAYVNPSDPSHVLESYFYDRADRQIEILHPDNQASYTAYGPSVGNPNPGTGTQQGSPTTYGYGYPMLVTDEAGKMREMWLDGFGQTIEVDEPTTTPTPGTGSVSISGSEREYTPCCNQQEWDGGNLSVTVNGSTAGSINYGNSSCSGTQPSPIPTSTSLASQLATAINGNGNSLVTATATGSTIYLTSKAAGANTNYSLSTQVTSCLVRAGFPPASFSMSTSGSTLTGGSNAAVTFISPLATQYVYDAAGDLTQVNQGVQTRTLTYDGLGRRTSMTTPEAGIDNFYFTKSDGVSLCAGAPKAVCRKRDARGITTTYTYNSLSQITGKTYSNAQGAVTYQYGQGGAAAFALGRLTSVTDPSGSETFIYDQGGRITQKQKVIGTTTFTISYKYNAGGQLTQITYPSGRVVQQNLDNVGLLNAILSGSTTYASIPEPPTGYNASGQLLTFTYGNGVVANVGYSAARQQMTSLSYTKGTQTWFSLNYGYMNGQANCGTSTTTGNDGLIQCIQDMVDNGRSVVYGYDPLNRLTSAVTAGSTAYAAWGLSETYDRYGNRLNQGVTAGIAPSNPLSFATTPAPPTNPPGGAYTNRPDGYSFDASGNMLNDGSNTLTYDADNCLVSAANSGFGTSTYSCDARGIRVKKALQSGTTTVYIFSGGKDIAEYDYTSGSPSPSSPSREYIYLGAQLIATIQGSSTNYHHSDHLSVRVTTDANGNKIGEQGHYPYGELWYATNTTTKFIFTSYERDSESGNDYAMARFYINRFGRFSCVDPSLGRPADPQSWNRYTYARNNPVNITDPSGQFWLFQVIGVLLTLLSLIPGLQWLAPIGASIAGVGGLTPGNLGTFPGTPPTFPDPLGNTQATLNSIYNPIDPSKFGTPPFLDPGSDYYDPSTGNEGSSDPSDPGDDPQKLFLQAISDCNAGGGREITYELKGVDKAWNIIDAKNYTVQEHNRVRAGAELFSANTYQAPDKYGNSGFVDNIQGMQFRDSLQTFTVSQAGLETSIFVRDVSGHDYGTNGVWMSDTGKVFVNGIPTPKGQGACRFPQ
jgi:RHS repeat-associated protein